jgi:hypothetical protein
MEAMLLACTFVLFKSMQIAGDLLAPQTQCYMRTWAIQAKRKCGTTTQHASYES